METFKSSFLLSLVIFLPAVSGLGLLYIPPGQTKLIRWFSFLASLAAFLFSLFLLAGFDRGNDGFQFTQPSFDWIPSLGAGYRIGIDGISLMLVLLTTLLVPLTILGSYQSVTVRVREFHLALLFLETGMLGAFAALDLVLFYVFWEVMLIPMALLIGIWGSGRRVYAAVKFFVYTMTGSLLMFLAILFLYFHLSSRGAGSFDFRDIYAGLKEHPLSATAQLWLFLAFALSFAIKVPLFPLHTWLPDAHTEAPAAGSVILAGVLLKMGTYGFIRLAIPFFPEAVRQAAPWISWLAIISIFYGAMMCLVQEDFKRLIAYSSVSHLGFAMLGIFVLNSRGLVGGIYQMLSHGISTGALFLLAGIIYERTHTRRIADYGGIAKVVPRFAAIFGFTTLASIGLPALCGFIGEFLVLQGAFELRPLYAVGAATGMVLGALYMLTLYQRMMLGKVTREEIHRLTDMNFRELATMAPLLALMAVMGMRSTWFTSYIEPAVLKWLKDFAV
ncbi:MAG: NADH-quinone oxidoreductase subunit M [Planctomycetes bacterium]|nr:NADH-quinone oxidoreductase subunit M [Planctomycetota bacterium]